MTNDPEFIKEKKFKIKIRGKADVFNGSSPSEKSFAEAVRDWWTKHGGMQSLKSYLDNAQPNDNSYLKNFRFEDDADDKETFD